MAYIGKAPVNGFHTKQSLTGDGSTTSFALSYTVADPSSLIVSVGGVLQEPGIAYTLSGGGVNIVFTGAPSSTDTVYVHFLGTAVVQNLLDLNGAEFILDVDADTSITADTDDEIDIKVGGTDRSTIKATGFHNVDSVKFVAGTGDDMQMYHDGTNSYLTNATGALKIATETSGIAITLGHTTSELTIADNATVTGNLTVTGTLTQTGTQTFDGGVDIDNFNINGTTIALSSGDMTLDVAGDIILDADGDDLIFAAAGTNLLKITNRLSDVVFQPQVDAKDIKFNQYDGRTLLDINDGGWVGIANGATGPGQLRLYEDTDLGANYSAFQVGTQSGDITYTLPTADGSDGHALKTDGSGTLTWGAVSANTPTSANGQALGSASLEWSDLFLADGGQILFGNDQEITLTHAADDGLIIKHVGTADGKEPSLTFQAGDTDIAVDDVLGSIFFQAPDEAAGTDAILVAAGIEAVSEGDFSATNNATKLSFKTAASEAATEKASLSSVGNFTISGAIWENGRTIAANHTISSSHNAMSVGPITINSGISVTVPSGSVWAII